ncbi:MAG: ComF family protein [Desulfitobacteriaceae bacterium]|nr:ComF family protein [Desulfitobacteriaceae bacterium]
MKPDIVGWQAILKGLIFPRHRCLLCRSDKKPDAAGLCESCRHHLLGLRDGWTACQSCATFLQSGKKLCANCRNVSTEFWFDTARAALPYEGEVRKCLHLFKYRGKSSLARFLGSLMLEAIQNDDRFHCPDRVVPVPLHPAKLKERGYNQAGLLAEEIARGLGLPLDSNLLVRQINTPSQTGLAKNARVKNLVGAFMLKENWKIRHKRILLVDDIYTTGATVNACAQILKKGGADYVYVAAAAAGKEQKN